MQNPAPSYATLTQIPAPSHSVSFLRLFQLPLSSILCYTILCFWGQSSCHGLGGGGVTEALAMDLEQGRSTEALAAELEEEGECD